MAFVEDLVTQGVSQTGVVEVVLGQPISQASDRMLLSKLGLPAARESLRQAPRAPMRTKPDQRVAELILKQTPTALKYLVARPSHPQPSAPSNPRIEGLKRSIYNTEKEIQRITQQLLQLLASPPPHSRLPLPAWEALVRMLRSILQALKHTLAALMVQLHQASGPGASERGASSIDGLAATNNAASNSGQQPVQGSSQGGSRA